MLIGLSCCADTWCGIPNFGFYELPELFLGWLFATGYECNKGCVNIYYILPELLVDFICKYAVHKWNFKEEQTISI